ncbi:MAG: SusC/RagA family TonB-linked outer membrane protein [Bacteroidales bacterium]
MKMNSRKRFLILLGSILLSANVMVAQKVTLNVKEATVGEAIESLKKQTGYSFWYKQNDINVDAKISIDAKDMSIEEVLKKILDGQPLEFEVKDKYVNIYKLQPKSTGVKRKLTGVVLDENNEPLPSVNITIKGTTTGTITDYDGNFSFEAAKGEVLVFSYVSYDPFELVVDDRSTLRVNLEPDVKSVQEIVVTALGVRKNVRALTYSAQGLDTKELMTVKSGNFTNSITGKVSNVNIQQASGGAGSATKIVLRGNNSLNGTGQPLIVIDGMPVTNYNPRTSTDQGAFGGVTLGSDGLSSINPDDIEDLQILKGPSAAALYGNSAANGAILITTKRGKAGQARIEVSTNTTFDMAAYKPNFQSTYGSAAGNPHEESWGEKSAQAGRNKQAYDDFLQTGVNTVNSVNFTAGNEMVRMFASYSNTYTKGLVPNNDMNRHNLNVRGSGKFFKELLELDAKVTYTQQTIDNPYAPGLYGNPLVSFYKMPGNFDLSQYKNYELKGSAPYESNPDPNRYYQNWPIAPTDVYENPYWITNRERNNNSSDRLLMSMSMKVNFTDWLNLQLRGNVDKTNDILRSKLYQGTNLTLAGDKGNYNEQSGFAQQYYADALLTFNKDIAKDLRLNAIAGASINDFTSRGTRYSGNRGAIFHPNYFEVSNINFAEGGYMENLYSRKQVQSFFYSVEFAWRNALFLSHTGRNDWASSLPQSKNSYFFPSVGVSAVISEFMNLDKEVVNLIKLRGSYTEVGSELPPFITKETYRVSTDGGLIKPEVIVRPGEVLKPELTRSIEAGLELGFWQNLLKFDFTYYKTNTTNQLFKISAPLGSGVNYFWVNGGDIQNQGFEASVSVSPRLGAVEWTSTLNFSKNVNEVKELHASADEFIISRDDKSRFVSKVKKGSSLGDMYAYKVARDASGNFILKDTEIDGVIVDSEPMLSENLEYIGNANPKFMMGWNNSFSYKNFRLSMLIDGRFGGKVISMTESLLDFAGNGKSTATARNNGGIDVNGKKYSAQEYYKLIGGKEGAWGEYAYDATTIRLRELSFGYSIPSEWLANSAIKGVTVSLIGRNLFYFYKPAPVDSEITSFSDNLLSGVETFALPATRSIGFGVNVIF